jgi:Glycosyl hydrolase family 99/Glycosyltransferase WbsX
VPVGFRSGTAYNHYSLLKTIEQAWGLAPLTAKDSAALPMSAFFPASGATPTPVRTATSAASSTHTATPSSVPTTTRTSTSTPGATASPTTGTGSTLPIRAAFFYPWFPQAWTQSGVNPYTNFHPSLGSYSSQNDTTIDRQVQLATGAHLNALIGSWWGQGHWTDAALQHILARSARTAALKWSVYYEPEGQGDPSVAQIVSDMRYLGSSLFSQPNYLHVNGKPVVFVYAAGADSAAMASRWAQAKAQVGGNLYIVLKVYPGYRTDPNQPDSWHQYGPATAYDQQLPYSVTVSPGFWKYGASVRLARDPAAFDANVKKMVASKAAWQLITTWNEWGEGTSVEPAAEFGSTYTDALCHDIPGASACQ